MLIRMLHLKVDVVKERNTQLICKNDCKSYTDFANQCMAFIIRIKKYYAIKKD